MEESLKTKKSQLLRNNEYYLLQKKYDKLYKLAKENYKFNNLMKDISDEKNILLAYRNIKKNKGSVTVGTDNINIDYYKDWSKEKFVMHFQNKLKNYNPKSVRRIEIPKPNGKMSISLIMGQQGRCAITGNLLDIDNMECHHKKPKLLGGTDEYKNLVWICSEVHKLIHCTKQETIEKYLNQLQLDNKGIKKLNSLRKQVGNPII